MTREPQDSETNPPVADEPPPFLGAWRRVYAAVLIYLAAVIFLFYLFGRAFAG
ncbi:MAG: hypothetical protein KIT09_07040 [Bryobacteraceae bacterium]|nr:hypothetical protein [Bryobacteraceae bacterium]